VLLRENQNALVLGRFLSIFMVLLFVMPFLAEIVSDAGDMTSQPLVNENDDEPIIETGEMLDMGDDVTTTVAGTGMETLDEYQASHEPAGGDSSRGGSYDFEAIQNTMHFSNLHPYKGETIVITTKFKFYGTTDSDPVDIGFYLGDPVGANGMISSDARLIGTIKKDQILKRHVPTTYTTTWTVDDDSAEHTIFALIDPPYERTTGNVNEEEEDNNVISRTLGRGLDSLTHFEWWDVSYHYRIPLVIDAGPYERIDMPVEVDLNLSHYLHKAGNKNTVDLNSIRVVEYESSGAMKVQDPEAEYEVQYEVPMQFDTDPTTFDPKERAEGELVFIAKGKMEINESRYFLVYFNDEEHGEPKVAPDYETDLKTTHTGNTYKFENRNYTIEASTEAGGVPNKVWPIINGRKYTKSLEYESWFFKTFWDTSGEYRDTYQKHPTVTEYKKGPVRIKYSVTGFFARHDGAEHDSAEYFLNLTFYSNTGLIKVTDGFIINKKFTVLRAHYSALSYEKFFHYAAWSPASEVYDQQAGGNVLDNTTALYDNMEEWLNPHPSDWLTMVRRGNGAPAIGRFWVNDTNNYTFIRRIVSEQYKTIWIHGPSPPDPYAAEGRRSSSGLGYEELETEMGEQPFYLGYGNEEMYADPALTGNTAMEGDTRGGHPYNIYFYFVQPYWANTGFERRPEVRTPITADYWLWIHKGENDELDEAKNMDEMYTNIKEPIAVYLPEDMDPLYGVRFKIDESSSSMENKGTIQPGKDLTFEVPIEVFDHRILNPSFENSMSIVKVQPPGQGLTSGFTTEQVHTGNRSINASFDEFHPGQISWVVKDPNIKGIQPNVNYTIGVWAYLDGNDGGMPGGGATLKVEWFNSRQPGTAKSTAFITAPVNVTGEWVLISQSAIAPANVDEVRITMIANQWNGTVYFDDIVIQESQTEDLFLTNQGFEAGGRGLAWDEAEIDDMLHMTQDSFSHSGSFSIRIEDDDDVGRGTWYTFNPHILDIEAGKKYDISVWTYLANTGEGTGGAYFSGDWYVGENAENYSSQAFESRMVGEAEKGKWVELKQQVVVPIGITELQVNMTVVDFKGAVWFDDLKLVRHTPLESVSVNLSAPTNNWTTYLTFNGQKVTNETGMPLIDIPSGMVSSGEFKLVINPPAKIERAELQNTTVNATLTNLGVFDNVTFSSLLNIQNGVSIEAKEKQQFVLAGNTVKYFVTVTNTGNVNDSIDVSADFKVQRVGWEIEVNQSTVYHLEQGNSSIIQVNVSAPLDAPTNERGTIEVWAVSQNTTSKKDFVSLTAIANPLRTINLTTDVNEARLLPGEMHNFTITVKNLDDQEDKIRLMKVEGGGDYQLKLFNADMDEELDQLELQSAMAEDIVLQVKVPEEYDQAYAGYRYLSGVVAESTEKVGLFERVDITIIIDPVFDFTLDNVDGNFNPEPNAYAEYTVQVFNDGNGDDNFNLSVYGKDAAGNELNGRVEPSFVEVDRGTNLTVDFKLWIPMDSSDLPYDVRVEANNGQYEEGIAMRTYTNFTLQVDRKYKITLSPRGTNLTEDDAIITPGGYVTRKMVLSNEGNGLDYVNLSIPEAFEDWNYILLVDGEEIDKDSPLLLQPNQSVDLDIVFQVPKEGVHKDEDYSFKVEAESSAPTGEGEEPTDPEDKMDDQEWELVVALPDLFVSSTEIHPQANGDFLVVAYIGNQGGAKAQGVAVELREGKNVIDSKIIGAIKPNDEPAVVSFTYTPSNENADLEVVIDPDNDIMEEVDLGFERPITRISIERQSQLAVLEEPTVMFPLLAFIVVGAFLGFIMWGRMRALKVDDILDGGSDDDE